MAKAKWLIRNIQNKMESKRGLKMANYTFEGNCFNSLIPEGDYEGGNWADWKTQNHQQQRKLSLMFRIRTDVEQDSKKPSVFWRYLGGEKDNPGVYNRKRINQLIRHTKNITDGQVFETIDEIIDFLKGGLTLIVHATIELDTYKGEDVNNIAYYKSSKAVPQTLGVPPTQKKECRGFSWFNRWWLAIFSKAHNGLLGRNCFSKPLNI